MSLFGKRAGHLVRPKPRVVHGIEIKKQPTLAYIEATERTSGLVMELLDTAFPGMTPGDALGHVAGMTKEGFRELAGRLMGAVPRAALAILREIVGAQDNPAWDALTPHEHSEVLKAFWEMNDLSAFFTNARNAVRSGLLKATRATGLNG